MRILITGGKGQLGQALQKALSNHEIVIGDLPEIDITIHDHLFQFFAETKPNIVIHCAAYTDVDGCARNPDLAYQINGFGTQNVALACRYINADLVHISTNEVFDGTRIDGYEEWMPPSPINPYGRSKAAAEDHVRKIWSRSYIVRTAWLYASGGKNFVHSILDRAKTEGKIQVVTDEIGNPTNARDLALALAQLVETKQYGIYHFVNSGACSRWSFANEILALANFRHVINTPILSREFRRASTPPPFGALLNINGANLGIQLQPWQKALADFMEYEFE